MVEKYVLLTISLIITLVNSVLSQNLEGYIVKGNVAKMRDFPHAALLSVECAENDYIKEYYTCGSSILNQGIVITAAHCLENCLSKSIVTVLVGKRKKMKGLPFRASNFKMHEEYDTNRLWNDIALVRLKKKLIYGKTVRRVALMRNPPYDEPAKVAGWGLIDEEKQISAKYLMQISQRVWSRSECLKKMGLALGMPQGTICGGEVASPSYAAPGDSGSGLMVQKYILIGVVSYKVAYVSNSLVVYTDVAYHYDWIQKTAKSLYCAY